MKVWNVEFIRSEIIIAKTQWKGWRVLSNDGLKFVKDVKTKKEAIELLVEASKGAMLTCTHE